MTQTDRYNMGEEHPSFKRARELEGHLAGHFPTNVEEANEWKPVIRIYPMHSRVLVVARSRIEFAWAAYCGPVPGHNHEAEYPDVLDHGSKVDEDVARVLFPLFDGVPYAR